MPPREGCRLPLNIGFLPLPVDPSQMAMARSLRSTGITPASSQLPRIGNQTGGRVFLFLHTDDFWRDYEAYRSRGVVFREEPGEKQYGIVAVFEDLYGNRWDLMDLKR